jgi:hypothetical protein
MFDSIWPRPWDWSVPWVVLVSVTATTSLVYAGSWSTYPRAAPRWWASGRRTTLRVKLSGRYWCNRVFERFSGKQKLEKRLLQAACGDSKLACVARPPKRVSRNFAEHRGPACRAGLTAVAPTVLTTAQPDCLPSFHPDSMHCTTLLRRSCP